MPAICDHAYWYMIHSYLIVFQTNNIEKPLANLSTQLNLCEEPLPILQHTTIHIFLCRFVTKTKEDVFCCRVLHSLPLRMSAIHVMQGNQLVAISHLIGLDQLPKYHEPHVITSINQLVSKIRTSVWSLPGDSYCCHFYHRGFDTCTMIIKQEISPMLINDADHGLNCKSRSS